MTSSFGSKSKFAHNRRKFAILKGRESSLAQRTLKYRRTRGDGSLLANLIGKYMFKLQDLQSTESWGPGDEWQLDGVLKDVPFAPFSKGDKLGRAADWTSEGKEGRDSRSRSAYNRNYRGISLCPIRGGHHGNR